MFKKMLWAVGLGLVAGLTSELLVEAIHWSAIGVSARVPWALLPVIGGMLIALMRKYFLGNNRAFGLDEIHDELANIQFKIMDLRDTVAKTLLTYVTLVFGFSAGKFGPLIHVGGAFGSKLSYHLQLEEEDIRHFIAAGVAASLSGFFSSPLFGIFFVVEILLKYRLSLRMVYPILAAIATWIPARLIDNHEFFTFSHGVLDLRLGEMLGKLLVVALVTGLLSVVYDRMLHRAKGWLRENERAYFPLIAGGMLGFIAWILPESLDIYYPVNDLVMARDLLIPTALLLVAVKFLTTGITFSFGGMGGGFAPAITIGLLTGYVLSGWLDLSGCGNIFGMVGMMAGYANAPISTAILFTGMMGDMDLFIPFLLLGFISSTINRLLYGIDKV